MRYPKFSLVFAALCSLSFALLSSNAVALNRANQSRSVQKKIVSYDDCETKSLAVTLNVKNQTSKADLLKATEIIGHSDFIVQLVGASLPEIYYQLESSCNDSERSSKNHFQRGSPSSLCTMEQEWIDVQRKLLKIPGTEIRCDQGEQSEDQPDDDNNGGVVIST